MDINTRQIYIINKPTVKGSFSVAIPLSHILGFEDDYDKVVYGFKHSLIVKRASDNDAIIRDGGAAAGKVELSRIQWMMPHVTHMTVRSFHSSRQLKPRKISQLRSDHVNVRAMSVPQTRNFTWNLCTQTTLNMPRYIIVGFQTVRGGDQTKNPAMFDHVKVKLIRAKLNTFIS
jgi:hypothetical protein